MANTTLTLEGNLAQEDKFYLIAEEGKFAIHPYDVEKFGLAEQFKGKGKKEEIKLPVKGLCFFYSPEMEQHTGCQGYLFPGHLELLEAND